MLYATSTKKGTGVELFGEENALVSLHETLHFLCGISESDLDRHEHALSLAYEIRKAFERQRLCRSTESGELLGTQLAWPHLLFYTAYFRHLAGYRATTKEHQDRLAALENAVESALVGYDAKVGSEVISLYPCIGSVASNFYAGYVEDITYSWLYDSGSGKMRFRRLPALVRALHIFSTQYQQYAMMLEREAKKLGCSPRQLQDTREWPEIEW